MQIDDQKIANKIDQSLANKGSILSKRAMLLRYSLGSWQAKKKDRKTEKEIDTIKGSQNGANVTINLCLDKRLLTANKTIARHRNAIKEMTLPYLNARGLRIAPNVRFREINEMFRDVEKTIRENIDPLIEDWDQVMARERQRLAKLDQHITAADYPSKDKLRLRYYVDTDWSAVPTSDNFQNLEGIDPDDVKDLANEARSLEREALVQAQRDIVERIANAVRHVSESASNYVPRDESDNGKAQNTFRDSLIDNVRELADILPALNITDDPDLADITDDLKRWICPVDPDDLRTSKVSRMAVSKKSDEIAKRLSDIFGA